MRVRTFLSLGWLSAIIRVMATRVALVIWGWPVEVWRALLSSRNQRKRAVAMRLLPSMKAWFLTRK